MAHIHLSWELGGGLGHAGRLKMLALALRARGHQLSISVRDLVHCRHVLADLDVPIFQAPLWLHQTVGLPPPGNLAEVLFLCGYLEASALRGLVEGWRALLGQLQPDLLVADYAPTALLAARSMGLRTASLGPGFYCPPQGRPLPPLRDWEAIPAARLQASEARLLRTANTLLAEFSAISALACTPQYTHGAEVLLGDLPLLCTWPELDHYERPEASEPRWFGPNFLPSTGTDAAPRWPDGDGPRVFAYLRAAHPEHGALLQALVDEGCRTVCYLPEVAGGAAPPVSSPLLHYAQGPVAMERALADADLCVSHGGEATIAQALLAGVPLLMLPLQTEQFLIARRIARSGAGYNAALQGKGSDWRALLRKLLDNDSYRLAARAWAGRRQGFDQRAMNAELAQVLERFIATAA